ncbi:MAG: replication-associated recombination protein A [Chloroflexi bacterium]|nr:replication-associated recombination protein A [Chloroflexota bacterium]
MSEPTRSPLPDRIRPQTLDEFIGQSHLVGPGKPIRKMIETNRLGSIILWGPPGVGKTTLARIIAHTTGRDFFELSAVSAGKDEMRKVIAQASAEPVVDLFTMNQPQVKKVAPILFLDEIHRFNKAQQDFLLPHVEAGTIVLIGATTENPSFEVIAALLSRSRVFVLNALGDDEVRQIISRGAEILGATPDADAEDFLVRMSSGDARQALNLMETTASLYDGIISLANLKNALQSRFLRSDKQADEHYNTISAFIKSMRASDPNAALHYLARMVHAGEDPKFIARRMVIFASEDVGMADANALNVANAVFRAVEIIGYPECQINLAHGAVYLAKAPKSRASCDAFFAALEDVNTQGELPIPMKLRNAPTALMKSLGYGKASDDDDGSNLPAALRGKIYFAG